MGNSVTAIILAAGSGSRMNIDRTKQQLIINGESVLRRSVRIFNECEAITSIIVVARKDEIEFAKNETAGLEKVIEIVEGGSTRAASAKCGFLYAKDTDYIAVHDAARCLILPCDIDRVVSYAYKFGAATAAAAVTDTVKKCDAEGDILCTVDRSGLYTVSTPQVFSCDLYKKALEIVDISECITDDNMLMENIGVSVRAVELSSVNLKITRPDDVALAEYIISRRENNC